LIVGALELGVPPFAVVYQFSEQPVDAVALSVAEVLFLHSEMLELLVVGMLGIAFIVSLAIWLESLPEVSLMKNRYSNPLMVSGELVIINESVAVLV
jgi:hypothetical protein